MVQEEDNFIMEFKKELELLEKEESKSDEFDFQITHLKQAQALDKERRQSV